ncbi:MAG: winged helix DNA-binding protein [Treponema sp.]|nr:winged helix DNA-binding protein [Treponema sp.]MBR7079461.1 winged helix DNA-binding protein [Treponema sp.]
MEFTESTVVSLISHLHAITADFTNAKLADKNLVSSHGFILYLLSLNRTMTKTEIAKATNRDKSTTTVLIRKLIDEGLVQENSSKTDARTKIISLTAKGRSLNKLTSSISEDLLSVCYRNFTQKEKKQLLDLLLKMNSNVENELERK